MKNSKNPVAFGIGIALFIISLLFFAYSAIPLFCRGGQECALAPLATFIGLPIAIYILISSLLSIAYSKGKKAETVYITCAILYGAFGLHDFIAGRYKRGFIHLALLVSAIAFLVISNNVRYREIPLTREECATKYSLEVCHRIHHLEPRKDGLSEMFQILNTLTFLVDYIWGLIEIKYYKQCANYAYLSTKNTSKRK